jgi:23S rRNA (cytosine1962-C5)-methyltransferase
MSMPQTRVILKKGKSKPFWLGHPWVFSGAVHRVVNAQGEIGSLCLVEDDRGNILGAGYYNPHGHIAVRLLQHRRTTELDFHWQEPLSLIRTRLEQAFKRRTALGLPNDHTTGYRLVNAEGDNLTGLIVDVLGDVAVIQFTSRMTLDLKSEISDLLNSQGQFKAIIGMVSQDSARIEGLKPNQELLSGSELPEHVLVNENGIQYQVDLSKPQKTGFFFDQRDNRRRFAETCRDRSVLDLYTFVGAFGLNAAKAGAKKVTCVDSSQPSINSVQTNASLNGVDSKLEAICGDAIHVLRDAQERGTQWDRIICDPPKYVRSRGHHTDGIKKYLRLNNLAMSVLAPGGLMMTCSCSRHVSRQDFQRMLTEAGHRLRRNVTIHGLWGQGADHPYMAVAPESDYLKAALISLD